MDQLQALSFNNSISGPSRLHHYHQHMSAAAGGAFWLPHMRDVIAAYLLRGRVTAEGTLPVALTSPFFLALPSCPCCVAALSLKIIIIIIIIIIIATLPL
jgi:hypothetical protein